MSSRMDLSTTVLFSIAGFLQAHAHCKVTEKVLEANKGQIVENGYHIEYRSGAGDFCMVHQVRNKPNKRTTKCRWSTPDHILFEVKLSPNDVWFNVTTTEEPEFFTKTRIGIGLTFDTVIKEVKAYRPKDKSKQTKINRPRITHVKGILAGHLDERIGIELTIKSTFNGKAIQYSFFVGNLSEQRTLYLPVAKVKEIPEKGILLRGEVLESTEYYQVIGRGGKPVPLTTKAKPRIVSIKTTKATVKKGYLDLVIANPEQVKPERILRVYTSLHVPTERNPD